MFCFVFSQIINIYVFLLYFSVPPSDPAVEGGPVVRLKAHTPHNLTCRASGAKPAAEITWYRDGEIMHDAIYSKVRLWTHQSLLTGIRVTMANYSLGSLSFPLPVLHINSLSQCEVAKTLLNSISVCLILITPPQAASFCASIFSRSRCCSNTRA